MWGTAETPATPPPPCIGDRWTPYLRIGARLIDWGSAHAPLMEGPQLPLSITMPEGPSKNRVCDKWRFCPLYTCLVLLGLPLRDYVLRPCCDTIVHMANGRNRSPVCSFVGYVFYCCLLLSCRSPGCTVHVHFSLPVWTSLPSYHNFFTTGHVLQSCTSSVFCEYFCGRFLTQPTAWNFISSRLFWVLAILQSATSARGLAVSFPRGLYHCPMQRSAVFTNSFSGDYFDFI